MKLFEFDNGYPTIIAEHLFIPEFKKIWDRDKSKSKDKGKTDLAYVYFLMDLKSPYLAYAEDEITSMIGKDLYKDPKFEPDQEMVNACAKYEEMSKTPSTGLLKDARTAVSEVRKFLRTVDLSERNKMGMPVYKPKEVTDALGGLDKVVDNLQKIEDRITKEEYSIGQTRGGVTGGELEFEN